jgi:hypothetical protein
MIGADAGIVGLGAWNGICRGLLIGEANSDRGGVGVRRGDEVDIRRDGPASLPSRDRLGDGVLGIDLDGISSRKLGLRGGGGVEIGGCSGLVS